MATRLWYHINRCKNRIWCDRERKMPRWAHWGFNVGDVRVFGAHRGWRNADVYPDHYRQAYATFDFIPFTPWGIGWTRTK